MLSRKKRRPPEEVNNQTLNKKAEDQLHNWSFLIGQETPHKKLSKG